MVSVIEHSEEGPLKKRDKGGTCEKFVRRGASDLRARLLATRPKVLSSKGKSRKEALYSSVMSPTPSAMRFEQVASTELPVGSAVMKRSIPTLCAMGPALSPD